MKGAITTNPLTSEADTTVDQLYAQVNKLSKKKGAMTTSADAETEMNQLVYAQVDKKQKKIKSKEVSGDSIEESEAVYSVVNKPKAPQLPPKSDLLLEELENS